MSVQLEKLPEATCGVRIEVEFSPAAADDSACAVFAVQIDQPGQRSESAPVMTFPAGYDNNKRWVLDSCALIDFALPVVLTVRRLTDDPGDEFAGNCVVSRVIVTALQAPALPSIVENSPGYNSWPMCQSLNNLIVCAYSRGRAHNIYEPCRAVYARVMSRPAAQVLETAGIQASWETLVEGIQNRQNDGPCPMEAATRQIDDPEEALTAIRTTLERLRNNGK